MACLYLLHVVEKPAYEMNKHDVDWAPCINMGHNKVDISTLQAARNRATRTKQKRQQIEEAVATSTENETSSKQVSIAFSNSESQMEHDNAVFTTTDMGIQMGIDCSEVISHSVSVQTCLPQTCDFGVQIDDCHFYMRKKF